MHKYLAIIICFFSVSLLSGQNDQDTKEKRVVSKIDTTKSPELVLIQEFIVNVPLDSVWNAYTTKEGWERYSMN